MAHAMHQGISCSLNCTGISCALACMRGVVGGKPEVTEVTEAATAQVGYEEVEDNPGRLLVPRAELLRFAARSNHRGEEHAMMRRMLFRALALSLAAASVVQLMSDATWAQLFIFVEDHF